MHTLPPQQPQPEVREGHCTDSCNGGENVEQMVDRIFQNTKSWSGLAQAKAATNEVCASPQPLNAAAFCYGNLTHLKKLLSSFIYFTK